MDKRPSRSYEFGPFRINERERLLLCKGELVPLTPKAFAVLLMLVQNSGQVVEKSELMNEVWRETYVEEANLTQNIFTLRKLLGQRDGRRQYIRTVPRYGYRFVAQVRVSGDENARAAEEQQATTNRLTEEAEIETEATKSLAVLPLVNESADPNLEYLSDGITESIINNLSQMPGLRVMARSAVFRYKDREVDPQEVGHKLNVQAVLMGRVQQFSDHLIIKTELVDATNGAQLWGEQYKRKFSDIFGVQEEIAKEISKKLQLRMTTEQQQRLSKRGTHSMEAYHLYLKGRYHWNKYLKDSIMIAIELFHQSIEMDPGYALAYTGLADSYFRLAGDHQPSREAMPKAKAAALSALEIDDSLAEAHASLGMIKMRYDWDWPGAEREFKRATELNPGCASAHQWYGQYLAMIERFDESIAEKQRAQELDPLSLQIKVSLGTTFWFMRLYHKALEKVRECLELDPNFYPAHFLLGVIYEQQGKLSEAIAELQKAYLFNPTPTLLGFIGHAYAKAGREGDARLIIDELQKLSTQQYVSSYSLAQIYTGLGDKDRAFVCLEEAYEERNDWVGTIRVNPQFDELRSDRRFTELLQRVVLSF